MIRVRDIVRVLPLVSFGLVGCTDDPSPWRAGVAAEYSLDEDGYATIYMPPGGDLRILQLSDVQLSVKASDDEIDETLELVERLLWEVEPDLVVLPGDLTKTMEESNWEYLTVIGDLLEAHRKLWMPVFGNHDCQFSWEYGKDYRQLSKHQVVKGLREYYPRSLISEGDCEDGVGNYFVNIKDDEGNIIYTLCAFDAVRIAEHSYFRQRTDAQIEWYTDHILAISALQYGEDPAQLVPSMVFAHLPLKLCYDMFQEVEGTDAHFYGVALEGDYSDESWEDSFFEEALALGSTTAMFFGHNHKNDASFEYDGIRLTWGQLSSYTDYYRSGEEREQYGSTRGGTLITISQHGGNVGFEVEQVLKSDL